MPAGPGVKVSGVVGLGPRSPRPANQKVVLTGSSAWAQLESAIAADGTFEIPSVPAGNYGLRTLPGSAAAQATVVVADRDVTGIVVPAYIEVAGVVLLQDGQPVPKFSPALMIQATLVNGTTFATAIRADGKFRFPLVEGEYRITFGKLPTGMTAKSIAYGSTDLLNTPLKLDGAETLRELRVTIDSVRQ